jgi:hypothetical protein
MPRVRRDHSAWLLAGPLVGAACLVAHALAYRLAGADPRIASDHSAHHYLSHLPLLAAPTVGLVVLALSLRLVRTRAGEAGPQLPWAPLALVAAPAFVLQEYGERLAHTGRLEPALAVEPTFVLGFVLATPLALAALTLGRLLLGSAERAANVSALPVATIPPSDTATPLPRFVRRVSLRPPPPRPTGRGPPALGTA